MRIVRINLSLSLLGEMLKLPPGVKILFTDTSDLCRNCSLVLEGEQFDEVKESDPIPIRDAIYSKTGKPEMRIVPREIVITQKFSKEELEALLLKDEDTPLFFEGEVSVPPLPRPVEGEYGMKVKEGPGER